jgi:ribosomal protein S18 acetylase RimI-like enzyme
MLTNGGDPDDVTVRLAAPADLDDLAALLRDCVNEMQSRGLDQWDEQYPNRSTLQADVEAGTLYLAAAETLAADGATAVRTDRRTIIGAFTMNQHQDPEYADVSWQILEVPVAVVHRLMVHPTAQRTGLGRFLMGFAERRARRLGFRVIRLDTLPANTRALALYRSLGYREAGRVTFRRGIFACFEKPL